MLLHFLLYKIYSKARDSVTNNSLFNPFTYIWLVVIFIALAIYINFSCILRNLKKYSGIELFNNVPDWILIILFLAIVPLAYTYFRFFYKKDVDFYIKKYKNHWLNKIYFDFLLFFIPFFTFLLGPISAILLFGGDLYRYHTEGLLIFLFK